MKFLLNNKLNNIRLISRFLLKHRIDALKKAMVGNKCDCDFCAELDKHLKKAIEREIRGFEDAN